MPPIPQKRSKPLTVPQIRVLRELADGSVLRRGQVDDAAGGGTALADLRALGLVRCDELEIDGIVERSWSITNRGREAIGRSAGAGGSVRDADLKIQGLAPWFGSARSYAAAVGEAMKGCAWVGVPFCGGLSEVPAILANANAVALNDKHRHLINLARVAADPVLGPQLYRRLRRQPFSAEVLKRAQLACVAGLRYGDAMDVEGAISYFIAAWMARSSSAGQRKEFQAALAIRWGAGGGNSCLRYANAVWSLRAWRRLLARCSITSDDAFDFLARCNDRADAGIYVDPPWPGPGDAYLHQFDADAHRKLAATLLGFAKARVVVRSGESPIIRRLYPEDAWDWKCIAGRDQANQSKAEWLIVRNG